MKWMKSIVVVEPLRIVACAEHYIWKIKEAFETNKIYFAAKFSVFICLISFFHFLRLFLVLLFFWANFGATQRLNLFNFMSYSYYVRDSCDFVRIQWKSEYINVLFTCSCGMWNVMNNFISIHFWNEPQSIIQ